MNKTNTAARRQVGEDLFGAEYLAGREMAAVGGFWLEFLDQLGEIQQQQFAWWVADVEESMGRLTENDAPAEIFMDHVNRRIGHCMEGTSQASKLWSKEFERSLAVHQRLWAPYLNVLSADLGSAD